jgi:hypothetical protein
VAWAWSTSGWRSHRFSTVPSAPLVGAPALRITAINATVKLVARPRDGKSATTHVFGESVWEHFRQHPQENETFNRTLAEVRADEHQQVADAYDWACVNTILDVGGGEGSLLAQFWKTGRLHAVC